MKFQALRRYLFLLLVPVLLPNSACAQQDGSAAETALQEGRYEDAIRIGRSAARADPTDQAARRALAQALYETGAYDEAIEASSDLPLIRGMALRARGRYAEAEAAFQEAVQAGGPDRLTAEFNLAEMLYLRGEVDEAMARFDRFIDVYNSTPGLSPQDLTAVGNAVWYLGSRESVLFQDAVMAFDEATQLDPGYIEAHIRIGELFVEKHDGVESLNALSDALELNPNHPRALLAMARVQAFNGAGGEAKQLVERSLAVNPNLVPARLFLARTLLDTEEYEAARVELDRALEVNPNSLEGLSTLAAIHYIYGNEREYERVREQVRQLNPRYAGLLTTVAEIAAQVRRYGDAARLAAEAASIDSLSWPALAVLGLNQFRLGQIEEARANLERSFAGDPYNVWIKNNLDLLDTFDEYEIRTVGDLEFMLHRDEADLLFPYVSAAATEAFQELTRRYGDRPRGRVRIELYPRSADFSVRTVGLAGLGALGVSFGDLVALDSPKAREAGTYNWAMTLWHEMAHTAALGVSNNRVPRWLTEGMSVVEELRARPGWERHVSPEFLIAYDDGELPPVSKLNEGFIRPRTPQHLGLAYIMGSLVAEWIEETRGFDALVRMLHGYRDGRATEDIFRSVLGAEPEEIDEQFDRWLRERGDPEKARQFMGFFQTGQRALAEGNIDEARRSLEAAAALFPVAESGSPYAGLAQIHLRNGDIPEAIAALTSLTLYDETAYSANLELARLLEQTGNLQGALDALERAVWIFPYEQAPHEKLAELASRLGDHQRAVRERRAIVGLAPTDMANARYQLALALFEAGDREAARVEVLQALEIAPGFAEAQDLLLRLHEST